MVVDYNRFEKCLLQALSEKYKTDFFTTEDVKNVMEEIKEPLSKQLTITDKEKESIHKMTPDELLTKIVECANNINDTWDRDNLTILDYMCTQYQNKVNCSTYRECIRAYSFTRHEIYSCRFGHSMSLYGCFMSIIRDKMDENICIIAASIVQEKYHNKNKDFKLVYNNKASIDDITMTLTAKESNADEYLSNDVFDNIKYILAEPKLVTIKHTTE